MSRIPEQSKSSSKIEGPKLPEIENTKLPDVPKNSKALPEPEGLQTARPNFAVLRAVLGDIANKRAFLVWVAIPKDGGGFDKVPCNPATGSTKKPNSARDRAVMTLHEAEIAMDKLRADGIDAGVGVLCARAGLTALDLDRVITVNGKKAVESWAEIIGRSSYAEYSPSGQGLRVLFASVPDEVAGLSNGYERNKIGFYGARASKFVTLTGAALHDGREITDMTDEAAQPMLARWRAGGKGAASRAWTGDEAHDGYPRGRHGMDAAQEDVLSGASIHPALVAFLVRAAREYAIDEAEEQAWALYHASEAKEREPERWAARAGSIPGIIKWIKDQGGYIKPAPSEQRRQAVKGLVVSLSEERAKRAAQAAARQAEAGGPLMLGRNLMNLGIEISREEADWLEAATGEPWHMVGAEGIDLIEGLREMLAEQEAAQELDTAREDYQHREGNDPARHRWMLTAPSYYFNQIAVYLHKAMAMDMPGAAALGALTALSTLTANRYYIQGKYQTGLNIHSTITASSGAGKDTIVKLLAALGHVADVVTSSGVTSAGAIHELLLRGGGNASIVIDEFAKVLAAQKQDKSGNSIGAAAVLLSTFESALDVQPEKTYSQRSNMKRAVAFPYLVLFGASTGMALEEVLDRKLIGDGTLNRSIMIDSERANGGRWPVEHTPPRKAELIEELGEVFSQRTFTQHPSERKQTFYQRVKDDEGQWIVRESSKVRLIHPKPHWHWLRAELDALEAELGDLKELAARFERNATVVAGLLRLGDYIPALDDGVSELVISDEQMRWAIRFVSQCIRELALRFRGNIADGVVNEVLIDARRKLVQERQASTRTAYGKRYSKLLDRDYLPACIIARCLRRAKVYELPAYRSVMAELGWIEELDEQTLATATKDHKGPKPKSVFRMLPGLYQGL
ncbi:hypothetical protein RM190_00525 [Paracoccus sp. CPCC 101403]|uniref:DUF927 domain-containing protein n=1 Tax=Paracoccus broussonetiae TaxID=3075834 RepID=A0ABU3E7X2_9RHOB|nr:hypothetical protein [Paracoccus sp. CPCC 101403]MDT1060317.1 hypothetical protein [Paracoccus sp. CPCC 101403]